MAGVKVELLVLLVLMVLMGTLLLGTVQGQQSGESSDKGFMARSPMVDRRDDIWEDDHSRSPFEGDVFEEEDEEDSEVSTHRRHRAPFSHHVSKLVPFEPRKNSAGVIEGGFEMEFVDVPPKNPATVSQRAQRGRFPSYRTRTWSSSSSSEVSQEKARRLHSGNVEMENVSLQPRFWAQSPDGEGYVWRDWDSSMHESVEDKPEKLPVRRDEDEATAQDVKPRPWDEEYDEADSPGLAVVCSQASFKITLPDGPPKEMKVEGLRSDVSIVNPPRSCGYKVNSRTNTLTVPYTGCNVKKISERHYSLKFSYADRFGEAKHVIVTCKEGPSEQSRPSPRLSPPMCYEPALAPTTISQGCRVVKAERLPCGYPGISTSQCQKLGCCMSPCHSCYYPVEACTADQHFVFTIRYNSASVPVDPNKLVIPGTQCKPAIVNNQVALFKFKLSDCGTRYYQVGETKVFMAEVQTLVQVLNLKYGRITRTDPFRFIVECRYSKGGSAPSSMATVGYMVKTPVSSMPTAISSSGMQSSVILKVAADQTYKHFLTSSSQPLRRLLGQPVFLELELSTPKSSEVILVNYCLAYPQSARHALVLLYKGCVNPYDPTVAILKVTDIQDFQKKRFKVDAFQFMDQMTNQYLDEVINFVCSTEVCDRAKKTCAEQCFGFPTP